MKIISRMMTNICSDKLSESRNYYTKLFDFNVDYDSDWFVHLISKDKQLELGIVSRTSDIVPDEIKGSPKGFYVTFVVEKVDEVYVIARQEGFEIISEPFNTFYGQRRLLLKDPNGVIVDISSPILNFE
jgi:uncharacterized glyoxalase superfamily protein PhnB